MDRRSWPWKKKTSEKVISATESAGSSSANSVGNQGKQDNSKSSNYVKISAESYEHFTVLEDQVKILNENLSSLNEKLSCAQSEITTKDNLVKQHAKVAEEAVTGWEKAEAETLALKNQLESVTLLKLNAENQVSHLDGALKECMKQIRNVKEESEKKLQDVVFTKTKQWEKVKIELEAKITNLEQEILKSSADNTALSRSLQERSNILVKIGEEKSQADAEIEVLKMEIQSYEKDISSLRYELHMVSKELEIRNEEKDMSLRSAEVANKQHLEGVKKIAKLEAECQRLRGLVRKKLPGPAALAQMKQEVENLGRDSGEPKRRSPAKGSNSQIDSANECSVDNIPQYNKEIEFLTARFFSMEEETNMLKEALSKRNSELQASRTLCAKTSSRFRCLEAQVQLLNQQKSSPSTNSLNLQILTDASLINVPSLTSMSEDGVHENGSCTESSGPTVMSDFSHAKKEKCVDKVNKTEKPDHMELMDDFLEMERLACISTNPNGSTCVEGKMIGGNANNGCHRMLVDVPKDIDMQRSELVSDKSIDSVPSNEVASAVDFEHDKHNSVLTKLRSSIELILDSQAKDSDAGKILEDIRYIVQGVQDASPQQSVSHSIEEASLAGGSSTHKPVPEVKVEVMDSASSLTNKSNLSDDTKQKLGQELSKAVSQVHEFVVLLGKETAKMRNRCPDAHSLSEKIENFSVSVNKVLCCEESLVDFIIGLSNILSEASLQSLSTLNDKHHEGEINSSDYVDKVTLLENNVVEHDTPKERFSSESDLISNSTSNPEVLQEETFGPNFGRNSTIFKCSEEEFEQLKVEKDKMASDLARCTSGWEHTKIKLQETEQLLAELKSELAASQRLNSLAETQLKCMAESYKSLETRAHELEKEMNVLRANADALDTELQEAKSKLLDALARCKDLEEQNQRMDRCSKCLELSSADVDVKTKHEREIAAAAEKLAECQETIFILGKQLKALRPSTDPMSSPHLERRRTIEDFTEAAPNPRHLNPPGMGAESFNSSMAPLSPSDTEGSVIIQSPIGSKPPKHRSTRSTSSISSVSTPEKNGRTFGRFFSRR